MKDVEAPGRTAPVEPAAGGRPSVRAKIARSGRRLTRSRPLPWWLFVVALAAAITFGFLWRSAKAAEHRRTEVASVANRFLIALSTFSGDTIDADVREIRSFAVGDFADQVDTFFDQDAIKALRDAKAKSVGRVQKLFVESLSGGSASVFGVVNEEVTNAANPSPRTDVLRIEIELIETKSGWKVSKVSILQTPTATGPLGSSP
jgi:Mce-associated membrane protein